MTEILFRPWQEGDERTIPPVELVGGKGRGLYWLAANGFPVPPTWVFSTLAFDLAVKRANLAKAIAEIEQAIVGVETDWAQTKRALDALAPQREKIVVGLRQVAMSDRLIMALDKLMLRPTQWAVRSSATIEDNPRHSFAGQFSSLLSVPGEELWEAIRQVWASAFGLEALSYCAQNETPLPRMAVILQPMKPLTSEDRSGVAFCPSPVPTLPGVLIQATFGTGQVVVDGYGGDLYSVEDGKVQAQRMPPDEIRVTGARGNTVSQPSPSAIPLTEGEARKLARLVKAVGEKWEGPVNVEFVWRSGEDPVLVQARSAPLSQRQAGGQ